MKNNRSLFPPLFSEVPTGGGGGGSGNKIQLSDLPEASLEYKDRIVQYTGETTDDLTNGFFYKCVEHTEVIEEVITVTYSWENIPVMLVESGYNLVSSVVCDGIKDYKTLFAELMENVTISDDKIYLLKIFGNNPLYYETSRPPSGGRLGFYQTFNTGSTIFTDDIMLSKISSEVVYIENGEDVTSIVPKNGAVVKLFSISVDNAI